MGRIRKVGGANLQTTHGYLLQQGRELYTRKRREIKKKEDAVVERNYMWVVAKNRLHHSIFSLWISVVAQTNVTSENEPISYYPTRSLQRYSILQARLIYIYIHIF